MPYPNDIPSDFLNEKPQNFIDELNLQQLQTLQLRPSPLCDDQAFLRRATLDTIGRLPTIEEREKFLAGDAGKRRDDLIEELSQVMISLLTGHIAGATCC